MPPQQIENTSNCSFGLRRGQYPHRQISNTITTRCDNDTQGVFPINATPDGLARTVKAQYYKTGVANLLRTDGFGATGVICVDDTEEPMYGEMMDDV